MITYIKVILDLREQGHFCRSETETEVTAPIKTGCEPSQYAPSNTKEKWIFFSLHTSQTRPIFDFREHQVDKLINKLDSLVTEYGHLAARIITTLGLPLGDTGLDPRYPRDPSADGLNYRSGDVKLIIILDSLGHEAVHVHCMNLRDVVEGNVLLEKRKIRRSPGTTKRSVLKVGRVANPLS